MEKGIAEQALMRRVCGRRGSLISSRVDTLLKDCPGPGATTREKTWGVGWEGILQDGGNV